MVRGVGPALSWKYLTNATGKDFLNNLLAQRNLRVLVIDDNSGIHDGFCKILCPKEPPQDGLAEQEAALFDVAPAPAHRLSFTMESAYQGKEGWAWAQAAAQAGRPYAVAFVDMRMPPGWDGLETVARIWPIDPELQIVICTAYSD